MRFKHDLIVRSHCNVTTFIFGQLPFSTLSEQKGRLKERQLKAIPKMSSFVI